MRRWLPLLLFAGLFVLPPDAASGASHRKPSAGTATKNVKKAKRKSPGSSKRRAATEPSSRRKRASTAARPMTMTSSRAVPLGVLPGVIRCPTDMVAVAGRVCVDRYEMSLVDATSRAPWSPFYAPHLDRAREAARFYEDLRGRSSPGSLDARMPIPAPPALEIDPRAVSNAGVLPQGYLSANDAERACHASGKRLCTEAEWLTACRGSQQRDFPYGERYEQGTCNVYRESHPSHLLHDNAARYHDDPRNNVVEFDGKPLLRKTGESARCASTWGTDAVYDMVGNLDEWVSDEGGVFVGGFYSRGTRSGCFSRVSAHPRSYSDYSTGARCCADPERD